jgi:hypothetical protein
VFPGKFPAAICLIFNFNDYTAFVQGREKITGSDALEVRMANLSVFILGARLIMAGGLWFSLWPGDLGEYRHLTPHY